MCLDCTKSGLRHSQVNRQPPTESSKCQTPTHDCCVDRSWLSFFSLSLMRVSVCVCVSVGVRVFGWAAALHATLAFWHITPLCHPHYTPPQHGKSCLLCCGFSLRFGLSPRRSLRPRKCASTFFTFHGFAFAMESGCECVCVCGGGIFVWVYVVLTPQPTFALFLSAYFCLAYALSLSLSAILSLPYSTAL